MTPLSPTSLTLAARRMRAALLLSLSVVAPLAAQTKPDAWVGTWQGAITVPGGKLEIALHLTANGDGYTAKLDSISQGAEGIPIDRVTITGDDCTAVADEIGGSFTLKRQAATPDVLSGTFEQHGETMPVELRRVAAIVKPKRPQEPKAPFPYRSEDVAFHHDPARPLADSFALGARDGGVTLAGTLTLPEGDGPFPAAVMITGSGPQDRDESLLGHKPFLVIADALTRAGYAVLRCDDRGVGKSTGSFREATSKDFARDALAAVRYLQTRTEIDRKRIGLIGHSEGGLIAPMVAADEGKRDVAFAVLIAPPAVPLGEVIVHQSRLIDAAEGLAEADRAASDTLTKAALKIIASDAAPDERRRQLHAAVDAAWQTMSAEARNQAGGSRDNAVQQTERMDTPWMRYLVAYDPTSDLRRMTCPTLALFGGKDLQVDPAQNEPPLRRAFADGSVVKPTIVVLPEHNHLFQQTKTGKPSEYATIEETFSDAALATIRDWLLQHVPPHTK